ncbi:hypothetical protein [Dactylosporangium sp. CS-033363]|uniref:hypothetical protein n=1 Tax=Dactylosporangium sp. CS-033363 TaxID=3239935 RepID=UPI003D8F9944
MRVWAMLLTAIILSTAGATAGSWLGGRTTAHLPTDEGARRLAAEIVPGAAPEGQVNRRDYAYGFALGDDDYGPGFVDVQYTDKDCAFPGRALDHATRAGWGDVHRRHGFQCDEWSARRGDLVVTLTDGGGGPALTFYRATPAALGWATLLGAVLGALLGAALGTRLRPGLVLVLGALAVLPGAALGSVGAVLNAMFPPALPFWTVWVFMVYLLLPFWAALVLAGFVVRKLRAPEAQPA